MAATAAILQVQDDVGLATGQQKLQKEQAWLVMVLANKFLLPGYRNVIEVLFFWGLSTESIVYSMSPN